MADITMCPGQNCDVRHKCYRYTAPFSKVWQSVFAEAPKERPCPHFWDNQGRRMRNERPAWIKAERGGE